MEGTGRAYGLGRAAADPKPNGFATEFTGGTRAAGAAPARLALPLALAGFGLIALSGLLMFAGQAQEPLASRAFVLKMALVMLAGTNAAGFHARGGLDKLDATARLQTVVSLGLWLAVIICGRWIACE